MKKTKRSPKKNAAFDRRDFIKTGAAAAALGSLSIERGAFAQASESSHAIAEVIKAAPGMSPDQIIIANLSGRGDKDVAQVADLITL